MFNFLKRRRRAVNMDRSDFALTVIDGKAIKFDLRDYRDLEMIKTIVRKVETGDYARKN